MTAAVLAFEGKSINSDRESESDFDPMTSLHDLALDLGLGLDVDQDNRWRRRLLTVGRNKCKKTNFIAHRHGRQGTCSAYKAIAQAFQVILPSKGEVLRQSRLFGPIVRVAFHDAAEIDITQPRDDLGPDGCLSQVQANAGLIETTSLISFLLDPIWQNVCDRISLADFWVMLANMVLDEATNGGLKLGFYYGRIDKVECTVGAAGRLPRADRSALELQRVFMEHMGLSLSEAGWLIR
jgi:hypothetical protein